MKCLLAIEYQRPKNTTCSLPFVIFVIHSAPNHAEDHEDHQEHHGDDELGLGGDGVFVGRGVVRSPSCAKGKICKC